MVAPHPEGGLSRLEGSWKSSFGVAQILQYCTTDYGCGYTARKNIEKMAGRRVDFLGGMRDVPRGANLPNRLPPSAFLYQPERDRCVCPEGKILHRQRQRKVRHGMTYHVYEAWFEDRHTCTRNPECCPDNKKHGRSAVQLEERGRIAEFCHAWIKSKLELRQFHVRGVVKVQMESSGQHQQSPEIVRE